MSHQVYHELSSILQSYQKRMGGNLKKNTSNESSNLMTGQPTLPTHLPQKEGLDKALLRETNGQ